MMAIFVGTLLGLVGSVFLWHAARSDHATRRWTQTRGVVRDATKAHLADDGRRWWNVRVAYTADTGEGYDHWARLLGHEADHRLGEGADVTVWYDPRRPDRCHLALADSSARSSWLEYALGAAMLVAGVALLAAALP